MGDSAHPAEYDEIHSWPAVIDQVVDSINHFNTIMCEWNTTYRLSCYGN